MKTPHRAKVLLRATTGLLFVAGVAFAFVSPPGNELPNFDSRGLGADATAAVERRAAVSSLRALLPEARVDFDERVGTPKWIVAERGFLTGPGGRGRGVGPGATATLAAGDEHRATKAFLNEHQVLFGFGPEALARARMKQNSVTAHNGLRTAVWEQELDGIRVFEGLLVSHTTRNGELVNISSRFIPKADRAAAAGSPNRASLMRTPLIPATRALVLAVQNLGETLEEAEVAEVESPAEGAEQHQRFRALLLGGPADVKFVWLPVGQDSLRLCWEVVLTSRARSEMYRVLIDAQTGEALVRHRLTEYLSDASYRVFTSDSPSPFSPACPNPCTTQPPLVARALITLSALDTNASPAGWIDDGGNQTWGNNVDAHTDRDNSNTPDLPRPQGSPFRTFDFALDLTQAPVTYTNAAVVDLFYWCNWVHDKLYDLGFTEASRNFQSNNFGRGGFGNDALQADAQDGGGFNNANMSTPSDGSPPRMQMYVFNGPTPDRDGDFDHEIVIHEYIHGLSNRRVGGGVGLNALQSRGMGEGWSDWYALTLLSEPGDDVNGAYAKGAYATYLFSGLMTNYYFGIRRYPYCTDLTKNPLTFKDIDPTQASLHPGIPRSPIVGTTADEVHNSGEVWCVTLWEARANLISKYGHATGNDLILRLVTDGMNLSPANPNFLQGRDAILQASMVYNGGGDLVQLWAAFARRGMGFSATSPSSGTTVGLVEAYDVPDNLFIAPMGLTANGQAGGPFAPNPVSFVLTNTGGTNLGWSLTSTSVWISLAPTSGVLPAGGPATTVNATILPAANVLPPGSHAVMVWFSNQTSHAVQTRTVTLNVVGSGMADDFDPGIDLSQWSEFGGTVGSTVLAATYGGFISSPYSLWFGDSGERSATTIPINTSGGGGFGFWIRLANGANSTWETADDLPNEGVVFESSVNSGATWDVLDNYDTTAFYNWTAITSTIPPVAQSPATLFRWRQKSHSGTSFDHWAIDSVVIDAEPAVMLTFNLPAVGREGDAALGAEVTASPAPTNDLIVSLESLDPSEVTVPFTVTILAGQSNAAFNVTIENDAELDGTQLAQLTATATGYSSAAGSMTVLDNETATLAIIAPATVTEGDGTIQGTLESSEAPTDDIVVSLSSTDPTELQVPGSVVLPAGQTSVLFNFTVVNDTLIDGNQPATIVAQVTNWTAGSANLIVQDNEPTNFVVTLPASAREGNGVLVGAGTVRIGGTLPANLVVSLASSDQTELVVPPTATILAGQTVAAFDLTVADDPDIDSSQSVTVTASAAGFSNGSTNMVVTDNESPPEPFSPFPAHLAINVSQTADLNWQSGGVPGEIITNDVYFGTTPTPGLDELQGRTTSTSWNLPMLYPQTTYYWQIVARKAGQTPGPVWQFTTLGVDHFTWDVIASPQFVSQAFPVTIRAKDAFETTVSNFTSTVTLHGLLSGLSSPFFRDDFEDGSFSDWVVGSISATRSITTATAAGGIRSFTMTGGGTHYQGIWHTLSNLTPNRVDFYVRASGTFSAGGYFVLADAANGSTTTTDNTAVFFYMTSSGMGLYDNDISGQRAVPYVANQWYKISLLMNWPNRRVDFYVDDVLAYANIPFRGTVNSLRIAHLYNIDPVQAWWDEIEFNNGSSGGMMAISPTNSGNFVNGSWTGDVIVSQPATNLVLRAADNVGHTGLSSPFAVQLQNDIAVSVTDAPDPVSLGGNVTYTITVTNIGPANADNVVVTNWLPAGVSLVSVTTSQGVASNSGNLIVGTLHTLAADGFATVTIVATATNVGTLSNLTFVSRSDADAYLANNSAVNVTAVQVPVMTIANMSLYEGNSGAASAVFTVTVSPAPALTTTVNFSTGNGTAASPGDFVATNGLLTFAPGQSNQSVAITINGDTLYELNETFTVDLYDAVNVTVTDSLGVGTILNDDPVPTLSIGDAILVEGGFGTTNAVFDVTLSAASGLNVTVNYATANGNATSGTDYTARSGSFIMPAGTTTTNLAVAVNGDLQIESDEVFYLDLSAAVNAILLKREGVGWIVNDDGLPGNLNHFTWDVIGSPQFVGEPFGVTISAWDAFNNPAINFTGSANLTGPMGGGAVTNTILGNPVYSASGSGSYTLGYSFTPGTNLTVTHVRSYFGTKVSIWTDAGVLIASQAVSGSLGTWTETPLAAPVTLNAGTTYRVAAFSGGGTYYWRTDGSGAFPHGTINQTYNGSGDIFPTTTDSARWWFVDLRYTVTGGGAIPLSPVATGPFVGASWTGNLTALAPATNLVLRADDGLGHFGNSSPLDVQLRNDVGLTLVDAPDPVAVGAYLTNRITVTNTGPAAATGVIVTNLLPPGVTLNAVAVSQGTYSVLGDEVICELGTLPAGSAAGVTIVIIPNTTGNLTSSAIVVRGEADPYLLNNSATATTVAMEPSVRITDVMLLEGNGGTTNAVFTVSVTPPPGQTLSVDFATANGTAADPADYTGFSGTRTFAPGETNQVVAVSINGDALYELGETFYVNLFNVVNATIADSQGVATIVNDDLVPVLSIGDVSVTEGNAGPVSLAFTVTLSAPSGLSASVFCSSANGTAVSPSDYLAASSSVQFLPGETNKTFLVTVNGDVTNEFNETLFVNLSGASNASIGDSQGGGTILNDDSQPTVSLTSSALAAETCSPNNGAVDPGEFVTFNVALSNSSQGGAFTTNLTATLVAGGGILGPSGPQTYGALSPGGGSVSRPFTFTAGGNCGDLVTATLQLQDGAANLGTVTFPVRLGALAGSLIENFDGVIAPTLPASWTVTWSGAGSPWATSMTQRDTLPNAAYCPDPSSSSANGLTSPSFVLLTTNALLTFRHYYGTESCCDRCYLQVSVGGGSFIDINSAGGSFVTNGYTSGGWGGSSAGFITTIARLPASAVGQSVRLRWYFTSDSSVPGMGWYVDSISLGDGYACCQGDDLSLGLYDSPDPVAIGGMLTYSLFVTNPGPSFATGIIVTNMLPTGATFLAASASQGTPVESAGIVTCDLGTLPPASVATMTIQVRADAMGTLSNVVTITRNEPDPSPFNNSAVALTTVALPSLSVSNAVAVEGNSGSSLGTVTVRLWPPPGLPVSANYATANGTALAGTDYLATNGVLNFAAGQTNQSVSVVILGDTNGEPNETFSILLSSPTNATLGTASGTVTIVNDDQPATVYVRATIGNPWGSLANETAMNRAFGTNNWQDLRFETVNPATLFTPANQFIFLEGSDNNALELQAFITANLTAMQNWVAAGGRLFINAAPNEGSGMSFGFGVTLLYSDSTAGANAAAPQHAIFAGPSTPVGLSWTGGSFGHATVSGTNLVALITNSTTGRILLGQRAYGNGVALFGGMTTDNFHSPQPQAANLRANILSYTANAPGPVTVTPALVFKSVTRQPGGLQLVIGTVDSSAITPARASNVWVYASTNIATPLSNWTAVAQTPVLTNGLLVVNGVNATNPPARFFRAIEGSWNVQPLRLQLAPAGGVNYSLRAGNPDGSPVTPSRAPRISFFTSTNAVTPLGMWTSVPGTPTLSNGVLSVTSPGLTNGPTRFFRAVETP